MSYYMNMSSFNEGEQAEAYKKRKDETKREKDRENFNRMLDRSNHGYMFNDEKRNNNSLKKLKSDVDRKAKVHDMVDKKGLDPTTSDYTFAKDATNRHIRRHPKQYQECGIFSEVTFLNENADNVKKYIDPKMQKYKDSIEQRHDKFNKTMNSLKKDMDNSNKGIAEKQAKNSKDLDDLLNSF